MNWNLIPVYEAEKAHPQTDETLCSVNTILELGTRHLFLNHDPLVFSSFSQKEFEGH